MRAAANQMGTKITAFKLEGRTSASYSYMSLPVPNPIPGTGVDFSDWQCKMIQVARLGHMDGTIGRVYRVRVILAMGNGQGGFAWACATAENLGEATRKGILRCQQQITHFNLYKDKTIFHDVSAVHQRDKVEMIRQPEGYGIRGSQLMRCLADLVGVSDVYIRTTKKKDVTSPLSKIRAFIKCLQAVESPEGIADRTGLHVVEMDPSQGNKPRILAEPNWFEDGDDDDLEEFDNYTAYFSSQPDYGIGCLKY